MFLKPMRLVLALAAIACASVLAGCYLTQHGESADPPAGGLTAVAGDGQVTISWTPDAGVEYWLFWGIGSTVDVANPLQIKTNVSPPFTVGGLVNGITYAFTINGRKDGGPGGTPAPVVTAVPRPIGQEWKLGNGAGTGDLKAVAYVASYDAVGNAGAMFQSADGITWTPAAGNWAAMAGTTNINAIINAGGRFIAAGDGGLILSTADNLNWTAGTYAVPPVPAPRLNALSFDGVRAVAVGDGGAIYYSDDSGVTWNAAAAVPAGTGNLYGVASSAGHWVAAGAAGTLLASTDGTNWVAATSITPSVASDFTSVAFLPTTSIFVAVGPAGEVATTTDGSTWTTQVITATDLLAVAASQTGTLLFVTVGRAGAAFSSQDGITWTSRTTGTAADLFGVVGGGGQFVAVGQAGTTIYSR